MAQSTSNPHRPDTDHHEGGHTPNHYIKIWAVLVIFLVMSILGPELGHPTLTLITAFGIAVVKAFLVAKHFMHLNVEKRYVVYLLVGCLGLMAIFYAGTAPDVMKHEGQHWNNSAAKQETKRALEHRGGH
jgi:caa(3)-type oxidase subunit IV